MTDQHTQHPEMIWLYVICIAKCKSIFRWLFFNVNVLIPFRRHFYEIHLNAIIRVKLKYMAMTHWLHLLCLIKLKINERGPCDC